MSFKTLRRPFRLAATALAGALAFGGSASAQEFVMKLSNVTINDPNHEHIKMFKARIEAATNNRIRADLFPAAQLGGIPRLIEGIQLGTIEWFSTPPSFLKGVDPRFQLIESPGVFDNAVHANKVITDPAFREPFANAGVAKGVKAVSVWMYGGTAYASNAPLRRLEDFRGKKLRVLATKLETDLMSRLGAAGVPIDFAEVLPALQQKTVDGVRSNMAVMTGSRYYTVTKFITVTNDTFIPIVAFVSTAFLNKLPPDLRAAVENIGRELEQPSFDFAMEFEKRIAGVWRENGAEVISLPEADQARLMQQAKAVTEEFIATQPEIRDLYNVMVQTAAKHRAK